MHTRAVLAAALIFSTAAGFARGEITFPGESSQAKLEALASSPALLVPPADLKGDFDIAKEPPQVRFAVFPGQTKDARLWSSWGDAIYASDGNFYSSIGDHAAPHGTAYVYRINPSEETVTLVVDYNKVIGVDDARHYTPGKIHGGLVEDGEGWLYFFGYRGSARQTGQEASYQGDWLLRYHLAEGKAENLGIPVPHCSVPVLLGHSASKSLYGLAVPGQTAERAEDRFFRYDLAGGKTVIDGGPPPNASRAMILADDGRAWYGYRPKPKDPEVLVRYDPDTNRATVTETTVPAAGQLRAASQPTKNGLVFCITHHGQLFTFDTAREQIKELGHAFVADPLYTATCKLDAGERYLYYLPGAHGKSSRSGTPVIQYNTHTGRRKVIAFLNEPFRQQQKYNLGGTYGIALSEDGSQLMINFNGAPLGSKQPDFGLCIAVVLQIPASERK